VSRRGPRRIVEEIDFGTAELVPATDRPACWTLLIDGLPQSHVDLACPSRLDFEYMRKLAAVVDTFPKGPLRVLHLGGGALALPRYVAATRPGSAQLVVERDARLVDLVRRALPLPPRAPIRVRVADARGALETLSPGRFGLVLTDVWGSDPVLQARFGSVEFAVAAARVLEPGGLLAINVIDRLHLRAVRGQLVALRAVFAQVCAIAPPNVLRGKKLGNVILVAGSRLPLQRLTIAVAHDVAPGRLLHGPDLDRFTAGAIPVTERALR
jgi:spermidine synthase